MIVIGIVGDVDVAIEVTALPLVMVIAAVPALPTAIAFSHFCGGYDNCALDEEQLQSPVDCVRIYTHSEVAYGGVLLHHRTMQ